jgi:hypothetical protein
MAIVTNLMTMVAILTDLVTMMGGYIH